MSNPPNKRKLILTGMLVGESHDFTMQIFDQSRPHTWCNLCGQVFQSELQRNFMHGTIDEVRATAERKNWSYRHARTHTELEHLRLVKSGRVCTPEAAQKLVALGIIPISDMIHDDDELIHSTGTAPRTLNDPEGTVEGLEP